MILNKKTMTEKEWIDYGKKHLLGKQIVSIRYLTEKEKENMMWYKKPIIIQLNDGTILFPSMDDEGNDGGALFGQTKNGKELTFPVIT